MGLVADQYPAQQLVGEDRSLGVVGVVEDPDELDATVGRLSRLFEEVRVTLQQGAQGVLRFGFGRTMRRRADLRSEGDPTLLIGAFGRDRDLDVDLQASRA